MIQLLHHNKRPLVYALLLSFGFGVLLNLQMIIPSQTYFAIGFIIYLLLILELFSTRLLATRLADQYKLELKKDSQNHFISHKVLPSITYFSLLFFGYFNNSPLINVAILFLVFTIFLAVFTNIAAYLDHKFKLEKTTSSVYDLLSIIVFFLAVNDIGHIFAYYGLASAWQSLCVTIVFFALGLLSLIRLESETARHDFYLLLATIFLLPLGILLDKWQFPELIMQLIMVLYYYYFLAFVHHLAEKTANWKVLLEYVVVFALFIVIIILGVRIN